MGFVEGVVWSLLGAVAHTVIDVLRKFAAQRLPPTDLIALLTLYNAAFAVLGVWLIDGGMPSVSDLPNITLFTRAVTATACMTLTAAVLYQRALSIAPLSLTVPYLAFAPVFVVFVSPMFLVGEVPSAMGLCGVAVVSVAGYKLGVLGAADAAATSQQGSKQPKLKPSLLPVGSQSCNGTHKDASKAVLSDDEADCSPHISIPAVDLSSVDAAYSSPSQPQQHGRVYQRQQAQLPLPGLDLHTSGSNRHGAGQQQQQQAQAQHLGMQYSHDNHGQLQHQQHLPAAAAGTGSGPAGLKAKSTWAIAYYKQKSPPVAVWEAACGGLQSAAQQLLASADPTRSPRSRPAAAGPAASHLSSSLAAANGSPNSSLLGHKDSSGSARGGWVDSQAKGGKDARAPDSRRGTHASVKVMPRSSRGLHWLRAPLQQLRQAAEGSVQLLSGPSAGPTLVLIVAFLYSLTASMDKLGMSASCSAVFYLAVQRVLIAVVSLAYLLLGSPRTLRHLYRDAVLLVTLSLVEQGAIVLYFKAIQNILVSYMVAIKRINVLLSTLVGCVMFKERVGRRMPYILLMLLGMLLIVLQPGHEALHHSHHTRR